MPTPPVAVIALSLAACIALLAAVVAWQAYTLRSLRRSLAAHADRLGNLERDVAAMLACSRRIGDRLADGERAQRTLQSQIDRLHTAGDEQVAVQHAMKLLDSGLDLREITRICELTEGEAEILQNLARHRKVA